MFSSGHSCFTRRIESYSLFRILLEFQGDSAVQPGLGTTGPEIFPRVSPRLVDTDCHSPGYRLTPEEMTSLIEHLHVGLLCGKLICINIFCFEFKGFGLSLRDELLILLRDDVNAFVVSTKRNIWRGYLFISSDQLYYMYNQGIVLDSEILRLCNFRTP